MLCDSTTSDGASGCTAVGHPTVGIYVIGMANHFLHNRVAGYEHGIWAAGDSHPLGQGAAWGRSCPQHVPFGKFVGNVNHDNARFGIYLGNRILQADST